MNLKHIFNKLRAEQFIVFGYLFLSFILIAYKYSHFLYTQLDLAIFANALRQPWSNLLFSTVQGHHYFGDHFMPYLIAFKPFFDLFQQSTIFLLLLQPLMIAISAVPLKRILNLMLDRRYHALIFALFFLNPVIISGTIYEFHPELLYIPALLWLFVSYLQNNFRGYLLFLLATLLIREDSLLAILPFAVLSLLERRSLRWILAPLISIPYLFISLKIIGFFNPQGHSLFFLYYDWLGSSLSEAAINLFIRFPDVIRHLSTIYVFEFILGGFLLFFFLPLKGSRYLILSVFSYLSFAMGPGQDVSIYRSHYAAIIVVGLLLASIAGLQNILKHHEQLIQKHKQFLLVLWCISLGYLHLTNLSPILSLIEQQFNEQFQARVQIQREALKNLDLNVPTVASYQFLDRITSPQVYFIGYGIQKLQQFKSGPYHIPDSVQQAALDTMDLVTFAVNSSFTDYQGYEREYADILSRFTTTFEDAGIIVAKKDGTLSSQPMPDFKKTSSNSDWISDLRYAHKSHRLFIEGVITPQEQLSAPLFLKIDFIDHNSRLITSDYVAPGAGRVPSSLWQPLTTYRFSAQLASPLSFEKIRLSLVSIKGVHVLNPLGTSQRVIDQETVYSEINFE